MTIAIATPWPSYRQALIQRLRSNLVLKDALLGDWSEGFAPQGTPYPLGIIALHYAPDELDWTGMVTVIGFDMFVISKESTDEADSLVALAYASLTNGRLFPSGQTSLKCRRTSSISLSDNDAQGVQVWQSGGTWEAIVAQSNPTLRSFPFTIDSTIT